ncbi:unnamed protein product [Danaus chrysippus]|uniref:(African queen) hypothetical protein n=1 Tax=Danaus chrysippus TaxID=151541 RepID=A0A8J2W4Z5_9NEOP|nr:unnamed protein product [Danaus chrysippus]
MKGCYNEELTEGTERSVKGDFKIDRIEKKLTLYGFGEAADQSKELFILGALYVQTRLVWLRVFVVVDATTPPPSPHYVPLSPPVRVLHETAHLHPEFVLLYGISRVLSLTHARPGPMRSLERRSNIKQNGLQTLVSGERLWLR